MSGFSVVRMARRLQGKRQNQSLGSSEPRAMRDSLRRRWNLSTSPLDSGWYAVVKWDLIPQVLMSCVHRAEENCEPLSVVMDEGTPKLETMPNAKASATADAVMSGSGTAMGQRESRSTPVRRYLHPFDVGIETMSTFQWSNRLLGTMNSPIGWMVFRVTLARWHSKHSRAHLETSLFIEGQTNLAATA